MFKNSFVQARIILTLWYTAFCMILVVLLNFGALSAQQFALFPNVSQKKIIFSNKLPFPTGTPKDVAIIITQPGQTKLPAVPLSEVNLRYSNYLFFVDVIL